MKLKFTWREKKREKNLEKHGLDFADAHRMNWDTAKIVQDKRGETDSRFQYGEERFWAFGYLDDVLVILTWTPDLDAPGMTLHCISFRPANEKEIKRYGK